jgi:outer membrane lipoprotein LolB
MSTWRLGATALLLSLAACAVQPVRQPPSAPATEAQLQSQARRAAVLSTHRQWTMQGRVALSNGRQGGSGRIDWQQNGDAYSMALSAPITRQSWRLSGDNHSVRLEGLDGGTRQGDDAEALLRDATGWVVPVAALAGWVRGIAAPHMGPATLAFDPQGRLTTLRQGNWTIDYADWQLQPPLGVELPHRLNASQDDARVRLVIDAWHEGASAP